MQINTATVWHDLAVRRPPDELNGQLSLDVLRDEESPGFAVAMHTSESRGYALLRASPEGPPREFWLLLNRVPDVWLDGPDTVKMLMTPRV